jgi:sugar lactone lactonase YvrE
MRNIIALFILLAFNIIAHCQSTITTYVGGSIGDGQTATTIGIVSIQGIATDTSENIYIIDRINHKVRKIYSSTGIITTIAGSGLLGSTADGRNAISVRLSNIRSIAIDASDNVYISESTPSRIRKIDAVTNIITTVAGCVCSNRAEGISAVDAALPALADIGIDAQGNIYMITNNRVRKVSAFTGIITTIAGNGSVGSAGNGGPAINAQLGNPNAMAVDSIGNIYIADNNNNVIRKIDATTGIIDLLAGNGTAGFSGDGGPAVSAQLSYPADISVDNSGNILIADNNRIRKISGGIITTISGNGMAGYNGDDIPAASASLYSPSNVHVSKTGNVYVNDVRNYAIRKITGATSIITSVVGNRTVGTSGIGGQAASAQLYRPGSIAIDTAKNVYLSDFYNNKIYKITHSNGIITTVAGTGEQGVNIGNGGSALLAKMGGPRGMSVDEAGNFYFIDFELSVRKVNISTGIITRVAGSETTYGFSGDGGPATSAKLNRATGTAIDKLGNLYIADQQNNCIRKVTALNGIISTVAGSGISGYAGDGTLATTAKLNNPSGVAVDNKGNIFVADNGNNVIRKVDAVSGIITTFAGTGTRGYSGDDSSAISATLNYPYALAADSSGNLYIADQFNSRIRKVMAATGIISTVAGSATIGFNGDSIHPALASINNPTGIVFDSDGIMYIADNVNNRIRKVKLELATIWTGSISNDWSDPANWSNNVVPNGAADVIISAGTNSNPVINSGAFSVNSIEIKSNATLGLMGGTLTIMNKISGPGTISGSTSGNLVMAGTAGGSAGILNFTPDSNTLNNFIINLTGPSASVSVGTPLIIVGDLKVNSGSLNFLKKQ